MNAYEAETDYAVPTGEYIAEYIEDHDTTQTALAAAMGITRKHLNRIIAGAPLTPDVAQRLELVTGTPARRWLALESTYRADVERLGLLDELSTRTDLARQFSRPAKYLRTVGLLSPRATMRQPGVLLFELMTFFRVGSAEGLAGFARTPDAVFRQSPAFPVDWASVATWLRVGELETTERLDGPVRFNVPALDEVVAGLRTRSLNATEGFIEAVASLAECGVTVVVVPEVEGCRAYGATRWIHGRPVVQLSLRGKTDYQLWLTLAHELGHVRLHGRDQLFVDGIGPRDECEAEADEFANEALLPGVTNSDLELLKTHDDVVDFARRHGVAPGIVVGLLHDGELWPFARGRDLYAQVRTDRVDRRPVEA